MTRRRRGTESERPRYAELGDRIEAVLRYATDKLSRFLCVCGGASLEVLDRLQDKSERIKHTMFGAAVLVPSLFGVLTGANAVSKVFPSPAIYLPLGLLWGATIFVIDRLILTSMRPAFGLADRKWQELAQRTITTTLRLAIGAVLAIVIATPLSLAIFRKEINQELHERQHVAVAEKQNGVLKSTDERIADIKQELATIKTDNAKDEEAIKTAERALEEENSGTAPSRLPGIGRRYRDKAQSVVDLKARLQPAMNRRNEREGQLNEELKTLDAERGKAQNNVNASQLTSVSAPPAESYSLLDSIEGLGRLKSKSPTAWWVVMSIELLFLLIELTPITAKLISGAGPYELEVAASQYPRLARWQLLRRAYRRLLEEAEPRLHPLVNRLWAAFLADFPAGAAQLTVIGAAPQHEEDATKGRSSAHLELRDHANGNGNGHSTNGRANVDAASASGALSKGKSFVATAPHDPPARPETKEQVKTARDMLKIELDRLGVHYVPGGTIRLTVGGQPEGVFADIYMVYKGREGVLIIGEDEASTSWTASRMSELVTAFENDGIFVARCSVNDCLTNPSAVVQQFLGMLGSKPAKSRP